MAGYMTSNGIVVRQGDSFDILLHLRDSRSKDVDLSGCVLRMTVKDQEKNKVMFTAEGEILDAGKGKAVIALTPKNTDIEVGDYVCDIELKFANVAVHTIYPQQVGKVGVFKITEQVTR